MAGGFSFLSSPGKRISYLHVEIYLEVLFFRLYLSGLAGRSEQESIISLS